MNCRSLLTRWAGCLVVLLSMRAGAVGADQLIYPGSVKIEKFETEHVIYKPGETVNFETEFRAKTNHKKDDARDLDVQVWIERELERPVLATSKSINVRGGVQKERLQWQCDRNVFGHRAWIRFFDPQGRLLAEADTLFDVASQWVDVMRMVSAGASGLASPNVSDETIATRIGDMRDSHFNALEMWTFSPKPYVLAPVEEQWPYQYYPERKPIVSKDRLMRWSQELHREGMKYIAYNETSAAAGPADWHVYHPAVSREKPYAHYFEDQGMFTPNSLKIADLFANELQRSIRMFGWDGILMDSAFSCHVATSEGLDRDGRRLTDLSAGEVGYRYLEKARELARAANPDFAFLSQNATTISHNGVKLDADRMYPWIKQNAERLDARRYSELVDAWTLEIDSHNTPRDGRYPLTYEKMSVALNSIVEVTGRPLMSWAFVVPPYYREYSVAFTRPYMALIFASRTKLHDHFDAYGGAWSDGRESPASRQFVRYSRFMARFSYFLWDPELRWMLEPHELFSVDGSRPLFWDRLVYRRKLPTGRTRYVINLLNLPSNGEILDQTEIPPVAQNVELRISNKLVPDRIACMDADDHSLGVLDLLPASKNREGSVYRIPPFESWAVVVLE
ncbi:MAG: hypothetical protein ISR77_37395 [Pirellulaceae bacterium]|nr:hypothetical protein [Pirellulaceae bacterium]